MAKADSIAPSLSSLCQYGRDANVRSSCQKRGRSHFALSDFPPIGVKKVEGDL